MNLDAPNKIYKTKKLLYKAKSKNTNAIIEKLNAHIMAFQFNSNIASMQTRKIEGRSMKNRNIHMRM